MKNVNDVVNLVSPYLRLAAIGLAIACVAKLSGFVDVKFGLIDMAAVAIACSRA